MWRFILVIAVNSLAAISMEMLIIRGQWRLMPFLFLATMTINFAVVMSARRKAARPNGNPKRAILKLAYGLIIVAVLNSLMFVGGWSLTAVGGVLGPLGISALLFRYVGTSEPA